MDDTRPVIPPLIRQAQAGDGEAFRAAIAPHRRELQLHCYRMLGSFQDAEDALQDTLLAAWQALAGFEGRASLRTWLYQIATHRCLNLRRSASRRPAREWDIPGVDPPEPTRRGEVLWLEPYPDALLDVLIDPGPGPQARHERAQTLSLAFVTALQRLPPRQLAALLLCDVLEFQSREAARMLDCSVDAINSALKRARAGLQARAGAVDGAPGEGPPAPGSPGEQALAARFVDAYEAADVDALVSLLTDDVFVSMPPLPLEYEGATAARGLFAAIFAAGRRFRLVPTRANGQPAYGAYVRDALGAWRGAGLFVLGLRGDRICALTRFESGVLPWFDLPRQL